MIGYTIGLIGMWILSDAVLSITLYLNAPSYDGTKQTWRKDHWVRVKLERVRNALKCFASHLWIAKDSAGHIWPFASCDGCSETNFCRQIKLTVEKEMN